MLPSITLRLSRAPALGAALMLSACGAGSTLEPPAIILAESAHAHDLVQGPPAPAPAPAPAVPDDAPAAAPLATEAIVLASTYTPLIKGTISAAPAWPVWYGNGKPVDGVNCLVSGKHHLHALISIYKDGKRLGFTDGIGRVHAGCYHAYELHTYDVTGIIHMETDVPKQFTLGQWFSLWQQALSRTAAAGLAGPVRFYIIEKEKITRYDGNPSDIALLPHREVLIVAGSTMTVVPKYQWPLGI